MNKINLPPVLLEPDFRGNFFWTSLLFFRTPFFVSGATRYTSKNAKKKRDIIAKLDEVKAALPKVSQEVLAAYYAEREKALAQVPPRFDGVLEVAGLSLKPEETIEK